MANLNLALHLLGMKSEVNFYWKYRCIKKKNVFRNNLTPLWNCCCHSRENLLCSESTCAKNMRRDATAIIRNAQWSKSSNFNKDQVPWDKMCTKLKETRPWCLVQFLFNEQEIVSNIHIFFTSRKRIHLGGLKKNLAKHQEAPSKS